MPYKNHTETRIYQDGRQQFQVEPRQISPPRLAYRVQEVAAMLGLPKSTSYDLIHRGEIRAVFFGKGRRKLMLIPASEINRILAPPHQALDAAQLLEQIRRVTTARFA